MKTSELSPRRERFVQEYLVDQNATQAYIIGVGMLGPSWIAASIFSEIFRK